MCGSSFILILALCFSTLLSANAEDYFGPGKCIKTFKDPNSEHCVVSTSCNAVQNKELQNYDVSIICISNKTKVRHSFGKGSFDASEAFDTLIICDQCLSGEASAKELSQAQGKEKANSTDMKVTLQTLVTEVAALKASMLSASGVIAKLSQKVLGGMNGSAPIAAPAPAPVPAATSLLHKGHAGLRGAVRNRARRVHKQVDPRPHHEQHYHYSRIAPEHILVHRSVRRSQHRFGGHRQFHQMRRHGRHHHMHRQMGEDAQEIDAEQGYAEDGYEHERYAEERLAEEGGQDESVADAQGVNADVNAQYSSDSESTHAGTNSINQGDDGDYPQNTRYVDAESDSEDAMESESDAAHDADDVQDQQ